MLIVAILIIGWLIVMSQFFWLMEKWRDRKGLNAWQLAHEEAKSKGAEANLTSVTIKFLIEEILKDRPVKSKKIKKEIMSSEAVKNGVCFSIYEDKSVGSLLMFEQNQPPLDHIDSDIYTDKLMFGEYWKLIVGNVLRLFIPWPKEIADFPIQLVHFYITTVAEYINTTDGLTGVVIMKLPNYIEGAVNTSGFEFVPQEEEKHCDEIIEAFGSTWGESYDPLLNLVWYPVYRFKSKYVEITLTTKYFNASQDAWGVRSHHRFDKDDIALSGAELKGEEKIKYETKEQRIHEGYSEIWKLRENIEKQPKQFVNFKRKEK